ncbi:MAG: hypothetical protein HW375_10 [Anaerolineales bacterium]|nr:hypothetical protein [Anaerolineales bacterium]
MSLRTLEAYMFFRWLFRDGARANRLARVADEYWCGRRTG